MSSTRSELPRLKNALIYEVKMRAVSQILPLRPSLYGGTKSSAFITERVKSTKEKGKLQTDEIRLE